MKRPNKKIIYNLIEGVPRGDCDLPRSPWSHADRSIFAKERKSKYRSALNIYLATNWKFFSCRRDSERVGDRKTALSRFKVKGQETEKSDSKFQFLSPDHEIRLSQSFCFFLSSPLNWVFLLFLLSREMMNGRIPAITVLDSTKHPPQEIIIYRSERMLILIIF